MVQTKADRERQKLITDKCQALIEVLLRDEDNKYCVDCDAKGPRWASWNLGIFLCIRCAGIHRNLGVHISRVKSVNLDAWTPDHVAYVQRMGNSRARAIYEANLPDDFRRPQTDTALESFIRAKYEHKRYIDQAYVDPGPPAPAFNADEELRRMKEQKRSKLNSGSNKTMITVSDSFAPAASATATSQQVSSTTTSNSSKSRPSAGSSLSQQPSLLFGAESFPQPASSVSTSEGQTTNTTDNSNANPISRPKSNLADLMDLDLGFGASNLAPISSNTSSSNTMTNPLANFDAFSGLNTSLGASSANATFNSGISSVTNITTTTATNINNNNFNSNSFSFDATPPTVNSNQPIAGSAGKNVFDLLDI